VFFFCFGFVFCFRAGKSIGVFFLSSVGGCCRWYPRVCIGLFVWLFFVFDDVSFWHCFCSFLCWTGTRDLEDALKEAWWKQTAKHERRARVGYTVYSVCPFPRFLSFHGARSTGANAWKEGWVTGTTDWLLFCPGGHLLCRKNGVEMDQPSIMGSKGNQRAVMWSIVGVHKNQIHFSSGLRLNSSYASRLKKDTSVSFSNPSSWSVLVSSKRSHSSWSRLMMRFVVFAPCAFVNNLSVSSWTLWYGFHPGFVCTSCFTISFNSPTVVRVRSTCCRTAFFSVR